MNQCVLVLLTLVLWSSLSFGKKEDNFACSARSFELSSFEAQPSVISPDGRKRVQLLKGYTIAVMVGEARLRTLDFKDLNCCIEIGWSPDSNQFFVMYSNSGGYARYVIYLYTIADSQVSESSVPKAAFDDFSSRYTCPARGPNNLFLLGWTRDSRQVFLVSEVIPAGDCGKDAGRSEGILFDAYSGNIVRRYGEKQTARIEKLCGSTSVLPADALK